jgi:type I restriction enzyme M protein
MAIGINETETVIKKILPYLRRRGYDVESDLDFETSLNTTQRYTKGYVDILVTCGKPDPYFLIEAKRAVKTLTERDRDQAIEYGLAFNVPFVVVTNGNNVRFFNTFNKMPIKWDGKLVEKIPTKTQLMRVICAFRADKSATNVALQSDSSLPFRPGLPLKQLNALFSRCHNTIFL